MLKFFILEALSHFPRKSLFFQNAAKVLEKNGKIVIADWFKQENLSKEDEEKYIKPIEEGMLLPELCSMKQCKLETFRRHKEIIKK